MTKFELKKKEIKSNANKRKNSQDILLYLKTEIDLALQIEENELLCFLYELNAETINEDGNKSNSEYIKYMEKAYNCIKNSKASINKGNIEYKIGSAFLNKGTSQPIVWLYRAYLTCNELRSQTNLVINVLKDILDIEDKQNSKYTKYWAILYTNAVYLDNKKLASGLLKKTIITQYSKFEKDKEFIDFIKHIKDISK